MKKNLTQEDIGELAVELEENESVAFFYKDMEYIIYSSCCEDGYMIDIFNPKDKKSKEDYEPFYGGLCTGSPRDAIEFML
jgi:hypothetical protein